MTDRPRRTPVTAARGEGKTAAALSDMPCDYVIDEARGWIRARLWGEITAQELRDVRVRLLADPAFRPELSVLVDMRDVTRQESTPGDIRELASTSTFGPGTRRALVTSSKVAYGMARMFQAYREINRGVEQTAIFDSIEAAEAWLASRP
jgi:SpoIIAA-like